MTGGRIPAALQAIFMASNRGEDVYVPPKEADKVYGTETPGQQAPNSRIPFSLQKVFMASNQGKEVHVPPADRSAVKVYRRIWRRPQRTEMSSAFGSCLPTSYTHVSTKRSVRGRSQTNLSLFCRVDPVDLKRIYFLSCLLDRLHHKIILTKSYRIAVTWFSPTIAWPRPITIIPPNINKLVTPVA